MILAGFDEVGMLIGYNKCLFYLERYCILESFIC